MEDAATAEISRTQVWQWLHNAGVTLDDGREVTVSLYKQLLAEELESIKNMLGAERFNAGKFDVASKLFDELVLTNEFKEFLTIGAYQYLD